MSVLTLILLLLGASVIAVLAFRRMSLPPVLGYLLVGTLVGPHVAVLDQNSSWSRRRRFLVFLGNWG